MGEYDVGQVCRNGHTTNDSTQRDPVHNAAHCPTCGERTITDCSECDTPIRGRYYTGGLIRPRAWRPPAHCHACGAAFPWTAAAIAAAAELVDLADAVTQEERDAVKVELAELAVESPRTPVALLKVKRFIGRVGSEVGDRLVDALVRYAVDSVTKGLS